MTTTNWAVSRRRNPLIAELLRRIQMVEGWGRGMPLILKNEPNVKFREVAQMFITSFVRPSFTEEAGHGSQAGTDTTIDKTIDKNLSVMEKAIIKLITANPSITQKEMAGQLNLTEIGIRYHINKLKAKGVLQRTGGKKAGRWKIEK